MSTHDEVKESRDDSLLICLCGFSLCLLSSSKKSLGPLVFSYSITSWNRYLLSVQFCWRVV